MPAPDLEAFLPAIGIHLPSGASIKGGTLSTNLNLVGPTNNLVTSGNVGLFSAHLAGFDLGSKMSSLSSLTGLKTGKDLEIEKMTSNLRMTRDGIKADNFNAVLPALGNLVGAGVVDAKNNLDFKMVATLKNGLAAVATPISTAGGALGQAMGGSGGGCKGGGLTVPFMIQGTTADPKFVPDVGGVAAGMMKSQLGCAGSAVTGLKNQNPVNAVSGLGGLFKKKKP
jgi:AsmA protein